MCSENRPFFNGRINMAHPDIDSASDLKLSSMGLQPYYNTTEKMKRSSLNSHAIEKMMNTVVQQLREPLPDDPFSRYTCRASSDAVDGSFGQYTLSR